MRQPALKDCPLDVDDDDDDDDDDDPSGWWTSNL